MMLFLIMNVLSNGFDVRWAYAEKAIAILPMELPQT